MAIIETNGLCYQYQDGSTGLVDVSLSFETGEFTVVAGANGSGKSTLLRHLNGLLLPGSGSVSVCGAAVQDDPARARQQVGMVFQDADSQIIGETVYADVAFGPENLGLSHDQIDERVQAALEAVALTGFDDKSPHHLSGGEKRRLAIAGVLAMTPQVLVMDEPFSNLDYRAARLVLTQILNLHRAGHTIIITTHDLEKVIGHAQRLIIMDRGRVVRDGSPAAIIEDVERFGIRPPCSIKFNQGIQPWLS